MKGCTKIYGVEEYENIFSRKGNEKQSQVPFFSIFGLGMN